MSDTTRAAAIPRGYLGTEGGSGLKSWIFSTDHKRVGLLYLMAISFFFLVAMLLGLTMRAELLMPGQQLVSARVYNSLFTLHGVIMIFLFIIPAIPGVLGNFMLPLQLGAEDVAFPRINLLSWWVYMAGASLALLSLFGGGVMDTGWTFYTPYSIRTGSNVSLAVLAAFVLGFSSILTGLNFITTIHRMRAPGMGFFRMPLFVWGLYATSGSR